jgi:hypothetical protein
MTAYRQDALAVAMGLLEGPRRLRDLRMIRQTATKSYGETSMAGSSASSAAATSLPKADGRRFEEERIQALNWETLAR